MEDSHSAEAGPSSLVPPAYLLQPSHAIPSSLSGSQDLLATFDLLPVYDRFVRPYLDPARLPAGFAAASTTSTTTTVKGKEKGGAGGITFTLGGSTPLATPPTPSKKPLKPEKSYASLITDIPGRNTIKKDRYLAGLVMNPDFHPPASLAPLDDAVLRDGFTLQEGQIPGFDSLIWEAGEEGGSKKKKKKRKAEGGEPSGGGLGLPGPGPGPAGGSEGEHRKKKKRKGDNGLAASP